jgi:putative ABC transport system substrate-binding protein
MRRRDFMIACATEMVAGLARAQGPTKPVRIGIVYFGSATNEGIEGFRRGLADKGYVPGRNLVIEERFAEGQSDRMVPLIAEVLSRQVDVVYAPGTQAALAAKHQTTTIPIVFISADPVGAGLVASLARPGGNLTGLSLLSGEYSRKWLELLKEAVPRLRRVGVLSNPDNPVIVDEVEQMWQTAPTLGLEMVVLSALAKDIDASLAAIMSTGAEGLVLTDDAFIQTLAPRLSAFAAEHHIPAIAGFSASVRVGLLMSYSVDFVALGRRAAGYVDRILRGARPADLPVEQASNFSLRINLKMAKALGLNISPALLARADELIE